MITLKLHINSDEKKNVTLIDKLLSKNCLWKVLWKVFLLIWTTVIPVFYKRSSYHARFHVLRDGKNITKTPQFQCRRDGLTIGGLLNKSRLLFLNGCFFPITNTNMTHSSKNGMLRSKHEKKKKLTMWYFFSISPQRTLLFKNLPLSVDIILWSWIQLLNIFCPFATLLLLQNDYDICFVN